MQLPVVMDHDVNSAAWAEYRHGASAAGAHIALLIALGTGHRRGLVIDGEIYRGAHGVAPELGHMTVVPNGRPVPVRQARVLGTVLLGHRSRRDGAGADDAPVDAPVLRQLSADDPSAVTGTMVAIAATEGDPAALAAMDDLGTGWRPGSPW